MAYREIPEEEYKEWDAKHHEARYSSFKYTKLSTFVRGGPLAQSVERRADNAKAVSSRLTRTTLFTFFFLDFAASPLRTEAKSYHW